jgi:acetyl-CoA carboxylase biotin carboxyl carrier protein
VSSSSLTLKDIQAILEIVKAAEDIQEFALKFGGAEIQISRSGASSTVAPQIRETDKPAAPSIRETDTPAALKSHESRQVAADVKLSTKAGPVDYGPNAVLVKSTMVGVFYRAPAPGEPPFVEAGQRVEKDQVLGILEVMKLMNSIPSPVDGTVTQILVENGDPVEFGQVLIVLEKES